MRIATFNLESLDMPPRAAMPIEDRIAVLRPQLKRLAADVICLQEINAQPAKSASSRKLAALDLLLEDTPYANYERAVTTSTSGGRPADVHNLVVLSRFPIMESCQIRHSFVEAPVYRCVTAVPAETEAQPVVWDRPVLQTTIRLDEVKTLHIFNAHLRAPLAAPVAGQKEAPFVWKSAQGWAEGYFLATMKRAGQALELRLAVDRIFDADPDALIAVCGDLNAEDREAPLRIAIAAEEDTGSGKLARRMIVPLERSVSKDRRFSVVHHGRPLMLDHILVSHTLLGLFRHLEIHNEALADEVVGYAKVDKPPNSYHAPMVAEFVLD